MALKDLKTLKATYEKERRSDSKATSRDGIMISIRWSARQLERSCSTYLRELAISASYLTRSPFFFIVVDSDNDSVFLFASVVFLALGAGSYGSACFLIRFH